MKTNQLFSTVLMAWMLHHAPLAHAGTVPQSPHAEADTPTLASAAAETFEDVSTPAKYALLLLGLGVMDTLSKKRRK